MKKTLFLPIIFALFLIPCLAQQTKNQTPIAEDAKLFNIKDYEGWQKVELNAFTFYIPSNLKRKSVKCYEGNCYKFETEDLMLTVDLSVDAWRPTFEKRYPSYGDKFSEIDGKPAWIWHFEDKGVYKSLSGVNFKVEQSNNWGNGIYLFSKTTDTKQIAEKVFISIKFNQKLKQ